MGGKFKLWPHLSHKYSRYVISLCLDPKPTATPCVLTLESNSVKALHNKFNLLQVSLKGVWLKTMMLTTGHFTRTTVKPGQYYQSCVTFWLNTHLSNLKLRVVHVIYLSDMVHSNSLRCYKSCSIYVVHTTRNSECYKYVFSESVTHEW